MCRVLFKEKRNKTRATTWVINNCFLSALIYNYKSIRIYQVDTSCLLIRTTIHKMRKAISLCYKFSVAGLNRLRESTIKDLVMRCGAAVPVKEADVPVV